MGPAELRRRFTAALVDGYQSDWYDPERHDPETVAHRMLNRTAVVSSDPARLLAEAGPVWASRIGEIRAEARRRGVPGY